MQINLPPPPLTHKKLKSQTVSPSTSKTLQFPQNKAFSVQLRPEPRVKEQRMIMMMKFRGTITPNEKIQ